jgi:hypothetical protein
VTETRETGITKAVKSFIVMAPVVLWPKYPKET